MKQRFILPSFYLIQEQERDHFSQFITEGFTSYCKRKRRDKVCNIATQVGVYTLEPSMAWWLFVCFTSFEFQDSKADEEKERKKVVVNSFKAQNL
jgi:hypothetical protein